MVLTTLRPSPDASYVDLMMMMILKRVPEMTYKESSRTLSLYTLTWVIFACFVPNLLCLSWHITIWPLLTGLWVIRDMFTLQVSCICHLENVDSRWHINIILQFIHVHLVMCQASWDTTVFLLWTGWRLVACIGNPLKYTGSYLI